jgi:hypothetical protein
VLLTLHRRDLLQQIEVDVQKKWEENKADITAAKIAVHHVHGGRK